MDPLLQILPTIICCLLPLLISFIYRLQRRASTTSTRTNCPVPQVCGAWPVIGHLHLLGGHQLLHKTLGAMADKHGPVFTIKLGSHKVLVVNSWETARECFTVHDKTFSTRPNIAASKLLGYDYAMFGFAPYGPYWCQMRKIETIELLSNHRLDMLKHIRASEVETTMGELHELCAKKGSEGNGVLVDMKKWFGDLSLNMHEEKGRFDCTSGLLLCKVDTLFPLLGLSY